VRRRRCPNVIGPEVSSDVAPFWPRESNVLVFKQRALDAWVPERPAAAQEAARADDAMGRDVFGAVAHRPADLPSAAHSAQQPGDGPIGRDTARRHGPYDLVHFFSESRHGSIVEGC
jgi:hypothetical protein